MSFKYFLQYLKVVAVLVFFLHIFATVMLYPKKITPAELMLFIFVKQDIVPELFPDYGIFKRVITEFGQAFNAKVSTSR